MVQAVSRYIYIAALVYAIARFILALVGIYFPTQIREQGLPTSLFQVDTFTIVVGLLATLAILAGPTTRTRRPPRA